MAYTAESDPLCYLGTTVLRNKLGLQNQDDLDEVELALFLIRADEEFPYGRLDYPHYMALHHHLFQDVYEWAGQPRTIRIGKGGNWFCYPEYIDKQMQAVFAFLEQLNFLMDMLPPEFASNAAHILAEINAIHPFREGNGRTQLTFLSLLTDNAGLPFDAEELGRERVLDAMIQSFDGNEQPLADLIMDIISSTQ